MPEDIIKKLQRIAKENPNKANQQAESLKGKTDYSGLGAGEGKFGTKAIPKYYEKIGSKLGWNPFSLPQDMEREAYLNQGGGEVLANTIAGFGTQALAGVIDSVAAYDMKGLYDMSVGNTEQQYGNWLNEIGKNIREYSDENFQIYQDGDSMWNTSYWAKQAQSLGYTGGIIAETIAEQVALAYLTGGTGNELGLASKARLMKTAGQGLFGMFKGVQEGYMNALETQGNVYQKYKDLGYDEAEAQKKANEAATLGFRAEVGPLAALNALQFMTTFGVAKSAFTRGAGPNLGFSGGVETLIDRALPNITNKYGKAAVGFGVNALSEGVEEGIQTGVSKYAQHETLKSTGNASGDLDIWDKEMRDSVIGGVLGGGLFAGAGKMLNKYTQGTAAKQYSKAHDSFLADAVSRTSNTFENQQKVQQEYTEAAKAYNENKSKSNLSRLERASQMVKEAQYNSHLTNTVNALQLDYINGKTTAFETHIEQMQTLLDAANSGDIDTLKKYNIIGQDNKEKFEGAIDTIKNTFEQNIQDSHLIKEKLENNLLNVTSDFESAFDITKKEYLNTKKLDNVSEYATALNTMYSKDTQFNQLSSEGKRRFQLEAELESFNRLSKLSDLDLQRKQEIQTELEGLEDYKANDKRVVDSINKMPYVSAYVSIASTNQSIEDTNTELSKLRDINNIREKVKERNKKKVEKAKSKEEVQEVVQQAQEQGTSTPELETIAENKQSELSAEETIKKVNPEFKPSPKEEIKENSVEADSNDSEGMSALGSMLSNGTLTSGDSGIQAFSPREFKANDITDEHKEKLKSIYNNTASRLDNKLGREANFGDFIKSQIEQFGYDKVDEMFEGLKYAWSNIGRDTSDAQQVYNTLYNSDELGMDILSGYATTEEVVEATNKIVEDAIVDNSKTSEFDKDNRPVDKDGNYTQDGRTSIPKTKAAFLGIQYVDVKNADGSITRMPVLPQLNQSEQITNHYVLDPDFIKTGTVLKVTIPENVNSVKVADWTFNNNTNRWEKSEISFGDWVKKYKVEPGTQKYNNKVPMVASVDGNNAFFLHDTDWYNTTNVTGVDPEAQRENIKNGITEVQTARAAILSGKDSIKIDERRFGSLFRLNTLKENNQPITLSEATGDTRLTVATSYNELADSTSKTNGPVNSKIKLVNNLDKNRFEIGQIYEIRKVNTDEYIALPVLTNNVHENEEINDVAYNNIKFSLIASIAINAKGNQAILSQLEDKYGMTLSKAQDIQASIRQTTGIDIQFEIGDYMNMFVQVEQMASKMVAKLEDNSINEQTGKAKYPLNTNYISVDNNVVKIVLKDGSTISKNAKGFDNLPGINLNNITEKSLPYITSILDKNFGDSNGTFKKTHFDVSKTQLGKNKPFVKISSTGSVVSYNDNKHGENTYEGYIKDTVKTNIKSFAIKDAQGNTKWVTDVQPMIYYSVDTNEEIKPVQSVQEKAQQAAQEAIEEIDRVENESIQKAIEELPDELKAQMKDFRIEGFNDDIDFNFSRRELSQKQIEELEAIQSNLISSLTPLQQKKLIGSLFNLILADTNINNGTVSLFDIAKRIDTSVETYIQPELDKLIAMRDNIVGLNNPSMKPLVDNFNSQIERLEKVIEEKDKITSNGISNPKGDLYKKFERFLAEELTGTEDMVENEDGEVEFSYNMSSLEKDVKITFSNNLKIFFANIKKQNPKNREDVKNFAYLNEFQDVDDVIQSLVEVMVGLPSSIDDLISVLETKKDNPTYAQILNKIKSASEDIQNEILYKMIQSKLDMHMVLYSYNRDAKTYSLKIINPNSSSSDVKLKQQWQSDFINSDAFRTVNEERVYNKSVLQSIINNIDEASKIGKISSANKGQIKPIFDSLGIRISDNTLEKFLDENGNNIFTSSGVLGVFKTNLKTILSNNSNNEVVTLEDENNNPYNNAKGVIDELVDLEIELNGTRVSKSFRVGGKSIQGAIQKMMVYDIKEQLKDTSSPFFQALSEIPYSKANYILELLRTNDKFRDNFDVSFVSLESIKQNKQKVYDDRKINKLATTDNMLTQYAFFQNTLKELGEVLPNTNLEFRMGHMFNPSLSDKEQMVLYSTALLNLNYKNFNISTEGKVSLSAEVIDFLTRQIFDAEFDRIVNTYQNPTNIKNYDGAAKRFLSIPELNNITSTEGANIHTVIAQAAHDRETVEALKEQFREKAMKVIEETMNSELLKKVDIENGEGTWFEAGFIQDNSNGTYDINFFDSKYLKSKKGKNTDLPNAQLAQIAALDFIVNQYLNQNNTYQLIAGDMSLYAPSIKKFTNKETKEIDNVGFSKAVGESITKRMAMLIAPGNKLANSKDDKYLQIFVNDPIKMTSTAREFIKQYYGSVSENNNTLLNKLNEVENSIRNLYNSRKTSEKFDERLEELEESRSKLLKTLVETNPEIGGYFDIEGTDAQEYTTWKEHMDILFRQGRLTSEEKTVLQSAYNKLEKGQELDNKELAVVMNPIKPVYAGSNIFRDKEGNPNVNRIVYIKSSSFPLLPQLTKDFKLDKIRQQMENLQSYSGKNVRLSYQTANKVGAIATKLTTNDLYNIPFEELYSEGKGKLGQSVLELDRNNFKIQQDTPYKTAKFLKKNQDDMTTMGSQMWKIILGNNINKIDAKIFPNLFGQDLIDNINRKLQAEGQQILPENGMVSGRDLDKIKFHVEKMYFDIQKEMLYDELGLNSETRRPIDTNKTVELLHALLERETTTRQYPEGIIDNLELTYTKGELEFMLPIWLSNGSNKFESLLQAIITNRLIQISLPGNQHISASSEGFEKITSLEEMDSTIKSQVVWVDPNHTGELKATVVDGKVKESEILVQSKFRKTYKDENGKLKTKLIDLTKEPYARMENGVLVLNPNMIDEELLTNFSFRIPTSSHQSGAILKVVGFLPEASGDMLVVPKEHTKQIGEDFDIDKRTLYKSNYEIQEDGRISKLNYTENNKSLENLMYAMFEDEYQPHLSTEEGKSKSASLKARIKMLENGMIDIYKSVYTSPDNNIQKKINKILSFDNATDTAKLINDRINSAEDNKYFSIYSDDYQRQQMKLGADGKTGIGGHSNAVTFQAQMERLENKIVVQYPVFAENGDLLGYRPKTVTIGEYTSKGVLGEIETLDGERSIGDVHTENQNSATDNIKAQIMGKRNENPYTMNVLIQLTFRGFDMAKFTPRNSSQPNSIQLSSLFISQPIIRRYVELKEQNKSITSEFDSNSEQTIIKKLISEFNVDRHQIYYSYIGESEETSTIDKTKFLDDEFFEKASLKMTGDRLYDNLLNEKDKKTWDSDVQLAVLQRFFQLSEEAKDLSEYQSLINLSTSGLGISYFNVLERIEVLNQLGQEDRFANIRDLVGDFINEWEFEYSPPSNRNEYTKIGNYYIRPTTTEGTVLVHSLSTAEDVMDTMFPYKQPYIKDTINAIVENKGKDLGKKQKMDLQYKVISAMRDYLYSVDNLGFFSGDINAERFRLFFDKDGNKSLASYLKELKDSKRYPLLYSNELLKSLVFDGVQTNGSPSIIKHQTDFNTNFDKTDKYNSFLELLQDDKTDMGVFNGEQMTPRKLAQDLATYAYLANNENGAIGFRDFINVKYLNLAGVSENIRNIDKNRFNRNMNSIMNNFIKQFYQHNPEEAKIFSDSNISIDKFVMVNAEANTERNKLRAKPDENKNRFFKNLTEFTLDENDYQFIAIRDTSIKLSDNQYKLFQWDGSRYVQIPVLGTFGYNEYNPSNMNQKSLIYPEVGQDTSYRNNVKQSEKVNLEQVLDLSDGVKSLLEQIYKSDNPKYKEFAEQLLPYVDPTTKVVIEAIEVGDGKILETGVYRKSDNTIYISPNILENLKEPASNLFNALEEVVLEEIIHSITISQLDKFGKTDAQGNYTPNADAPVFITKLAKLHEIAKQKLPGEYYTKNMYEFVAGAFVSEEFKQKLDSTMVNGKSLFDMFKDAIAAMVRFVKGTSYSDETVKTVYDLIKYTNNTEVVEDINNVIEDMKKKDTLVEVEINNIVGNERPNIVDRTSIKGMETYNKEVSNQILQDFDAGKEFIITPTKLRDKNSAEYKYMNDLIAHVNSTLPEGKTLTDMIVITNIDENTQSIKKVRSIGGLLSSGLLTSGGDSYSAREFRLPEIKNCK